MVVVFAFQRLKLGFVPAAPLNSSSNRYDANGVVVVVVPVTVTVTVGTVVVAQFVTAATVATGDPLSLRVCAGEVAHTDTVPAVSATTAATPTPRAATTAARTTERERTLLPCLANEREPAGVLVPLELPDGIRDLVDASPRPAVMGRTENEHVSLAVEPVTQIRRLVQDDVEVCDDLVEHHGIVLERPFSRPLELVMVGFHRPTTGMCNAANPAGLIHLDNEPVVNLAVLWGGFARIVLRIERYLAERPVQLAH